VNVTLSAVKEALLFGTESSDAPFTRA
jgi:hypothetical protein